MADNAKAIKKAFLEALEDSKQDIIGRSTPKVVSEAMGKVLELEEYGESPEAIHTMQEGKLVKALFFCHAIAIDRYANLVIRMIKDGVLEVNVDNIGKKVSGIWEKLKEALNEEENGDEDDDA